VINKSETAQDTIYHVIYSNSRPRHTKLNHCVSVRVRGCVCEKKLAKMETMLCEARTEVMTLRLQQLK